MKILITGANSLLGKYLTKELAAQNLLFLSFHELPNDTFFDSSAFNKLKLDILQQQNVYKVISEIKPQVIIHLASISNIDYCENHPKLAHEVNVHGTKNICGAIANSNIHLIFASSNAVFDGTSPPYSESAKPSPLNIYGKNKFESEKMIMSANFPSTIVRFTTLFGWPPKGARENDVTYYLKHLNSDPFINLVNDRYFNPVSAWAASTAVNKIMQNKLPGIFHVAGLDRVNRYQLVNMIIKEFKLTPKARLIPVSSDYFPNLANRPKDATLAITKMKKILEIIPKGLFNELSQLSQSIPFNS